MAEQPARDEQSAIHLIVRGHVQGVGFRYFLKQSADAHAVSGWVRNLRNGNVEAVLIGTAGAVGAVVDAVRRGPRSARVDEVITRAACDDEAARARRPLEVTRTP